MANESIYAAFERMWQHIIAKLGNLVSYTDSQTLSDDQKIMATTNIGAKPEDVMATISGTYVSGTGIVYSCDKTFEDLWTANEEGRDIIFNFSGYHNVKGEFHNINTENGKVRQIHIRVFSTTNYSSYVIDEDNTVTLTQANLLNSRMIATTTGTNASFVMSQKAVTEALNTKLATPDVAEVNQVLSVKEIDENGKPVEWECVEIPNDGGGGSGGVNYNITKLTTTEEVEKIKIPLKNYEDTELFLYVKTGSSEFKYKFGLCLPGIGNNKYNQYGINAAETAQYGFPYYLRILNKTESPYNRGIFIFRKNAILPWVGPYYTTDEPHFSLAANTNGEFFPVGTEIELIEVYK